MEELAFLIVLQTDNNGGIGMLISLQTDRQTTSIYNILVILNPKKTTI